jgi:hypothetical protein
VLERVFGALRLGGGEGERPAFVEGMLLGAMVGAAIAGSTLWSRWRGGRQREAGVAGPTEPTGLAKRA